MPTIVALGEMLIDFAPVAADAAGYTGNLRPKAENEGRNNLTPTLVYGHVTFVLYNSNGTVNTEVTVNVYCNQKGTTWIERQG